MEKEERENIVTLNEDKIEFAPPNKSKFNTVQRLLSDFEDQTFTFCANPKNCAEFNNVMSCIEEWLNYTLLCNKENLVKYIKNDIEHGTYGAAYNLISYFEQYVELAKPLYQVDIEKTQQQFKEQEERRRQQDEIAEQKRLEEKERVRREYLEEARKVSQANHEAEERRRQAALKQEEDGW